jgi:hypothetical protein
MHGAALKCLLDTPMSLLQLCSRVLRRALTPHENPRCTGNYAFSPICNSANLKGTPQPPMPQYALGFFARYCW